MDEVLIRNALNSMLEATEDDATPIIRRLARVQARAALDTLASAPAGDGVQRELTPTLIASARGHLANVKAHGNAEANACLVFEAVLDAAAALARPHSAVAPAGDGYGKWHPMLLDLVNAIHGDRGEKTQAIGIDLSYQQALAAALARPRAAVGERSREAIARIVDPEPWQDVSGEDTYPAMLRRIDERKAAALAKADAILALQSPPAKVEG